jgi:hypothetical protein
VTHRWARKTIAAMLGAAVSVSALTSLAQTLGGYAQYCRNVSGRTVCNPATASDGTRAYEHWDNGAPAQASGSASTYRYRPDASALGRPNTLYSFGK